MNRMARTLSFGSSEDFDSAASEVRICITYCTYKCGDDVSVKCLVPKAICEYFGTYHEKKIGAHLEQWQQ